MKTLKRPLVLVSTLIAVTLLLSWRYFDHDAPSGSSLTATNYLTDVTAAFLAESGDLPLSDVMPGAEDVLVQRIPGDNNHMLMMAYYSKENYSGPAFTINNGSILTFRDDGKGDDQKAGDGLYTAKIAADVQAFRKQAISMNHQMKACNYKSMRYKNRELIQDPDAAETFDLQQFDAHHPTTVSGLTDALSDDLTTPASTFSSSARNSTVAFNSATALAATATTTARPTLLDSIRRNSILITNLGVVEDPARTWNYCTQTGNSNGAWTFGTLMRQLASKTPGQIATNAQVSNFVKNWLRTWDSTLVINSDTVNARTLIDSRIIDPWLTKSQNAGAPSGQLNMKFAPFKLIAIVNRFDLRDGQRFGNEGSPCGEARFVFSLVNSDCTGSLPMTVIFEYGIHINTKDTCGAQHTWAQQWFNLKNFALGSSQYNQALQNITDQFTLCGTNTSKPNQSSLDQLRTNEVTLASKPKTWEFREFTLDSATGNLMETTVKQVPADKYNAKTVNDDVQRMVTYVNNHAGGIKGERHTLPLKVQGAPFLAGSSRINGTPTGTPPNAYYWDGTGASSAATFIADNDARYSFSLGTCSGCHGGETQTSFTHIDTAFFGKEAKLSGFLSGKAGAGGAIDFDNDSTNDIFTVEDAALRPSASDASLRHFNDIKARARGLKNFVSSTCGSVLGISSQLMFQPVNMVD